MTLFGLVIPGLVVWGVFGGCVAEFAGWYQLARLDPKSKRRAEGWRRIRSPFYIMTTLVMIAIGGGFVYAYTTLPDVHLNAILAMNIGASAPLLAQTLGRETPVELPKID